MRLNFIQPPRAKEKRKHWSLPNRNTWLAGREVCEPVTTSQHKTQMQSALGPQWLHTPTITTLERWWQDPEFKVIRDTDSLSPARVFETLLHRHTHTKCGSTEREGLVISLSWRKDGHDPAQQMCLEIPRVGCLEERKHRPQTAGYCRRLRAAGGGEPEGEWEA